MLNIIGAGDEKDFVIIIIIGIIHFFITNVLAQRK
jgi:hypothetical protein